MNQQAHSTTIVCVRRNNKVAMGGDGQVSLGHTIMKGNAKKVRYLFHDNILAGFAGSTADAFTLFERFEKKLEQYQGHLIKASVEMAKDWRTDKVLRRLEAMLVVADKHSLLLISGNGDVIEPDEDLIAIGSGGDYAKSSALALLRHSDLSAEDIVRQSLTIAADICIYTNHHFTFLSLPQTN